MQKDGYDYDRLLNPLWWLKHIRTDLRHDYEHGENTNIRKKTQNIAEAYLALVGSRVLPSSSEELRKLQLSLYKKLTKMLKEFADLEEEIRSRQSGGINSD